MKRRKTAPTATENVATPSFSSLLENLENDAGLHGLRHKLHQIDNHPIMGIRESKAARTDAESSAAYKSTSKDAAKWLRQISHNAFCEQLCLEGSRGSLFQSPASAVNQATAINAFEKELEEATNASGVTQDAIKESKALPLAEKIKDKTAHQRLAQLRAILFREQRKNKRLKKIKSRMWRRVNRRADAKEFDTLLGRLDAESPEVAARIRADIEEKRASLRMLRKQTARKNWTKVALRYGGKSMQKVVSHEAQRAHDYKQSVTQTAKQHITTDSNDHIEDSEDPSDYDNDFHSEKPMDEEEKSFLESAREILKLGPNATKEEDTPSVSLGGLENMKFMKRAAEAEQLKEFLEADALVPAYDTANTESGDSGDSDIDGEPLPAHSDNRGKKDLLKKSQGSQAPEFSAEELEAAAATVRPLLENAWAASSLTNPTAVGRIVKRNETQNTLAHPPAPTIIDTSAAIEQLLDSDTVSRELTNENTDQAELIREAFAQDNPNLKEGSIEDDPLAIPENDANHQRKVKTKKGTMAGWGEWAEDGDDSSSSRLLSSRVIHSTAKSTAASDGPTGIQSPACKRQYYISRRLDKKLANYFVPTIPHPYTTKEQFELVQQQPIGPEWNTEEVHRRFVKPQVTVRDGTVIMPLEHAKNLPKAELDGLLDAWTNRSKAAKRLQAARKCL